MVDILPVSFNRTVDLHPLDLVLDCGRMGTFASVEGLEFGYIFL